ncbi:TIGR03086 family protein [Virgisporangium aliadipatigenens]|uniref:TIGR03086 family protein n=1 Tax=Virgisporangium aliadipatigenens TaxID=741659 RepID=A0A8J3YRD3_9ACTN|nr:TIGR03086 family metal-binding protein [Virgisporangium aliadipatigenens]GIJ50449.1 TIGR03086 family protein [Virgisporangium aliadipatigenens]
MTVDFGPATDVLSGLVKQTTDEQLAAQTPGGITVAALLDHIDGLAGAFADAATKTTKADGGVAQAPDGARLRDGWRERIPARLDALAEAWRSDTAWSGLTVIGGLEMPGDAAGAVGLDEVIVHGWDLAVATGQRYPGGDAALQDGIRAAYGWVSATVGDNPNGIPGLFGPAVKVPADAPLIDRLLGLAGRDPGA